MALAAVSLADKYELESGRVYLTGTQALVRLPMMQRQRDRRAGLSTAGFISGYRGSPLGTFDQQLWRAKTFLDRADIHFSPGVNEDMAATAVWGSQQINLWPDGKVDGVFGIWFGKGPGVDRSGDVFRHANLAGTAPLGGVLALAGDDHACKSSTVPSQSEHGFASVMMPVLHPASLQEVLDLGLHGWAMSRYSGCWVGFKCISETIDCSASVAVDPDRVATVIPVDYEIPPGGLNIRWPDPPLAQEERLMRHKIYAARAYCRANGLDRVTLRCPKPRFGIVTTGKSWLDVNQALENLGIDEAVAESIGLSVYKVGMPWPLEPVGIRTFAEGLDELIVVEEKRALIENQLKEQLYNWQAAKRPVIIGKFDEDRNWVLPSMGELSPGQIAILIGQRLLRRIDHSVIAERVAFIEAREAQRLSHRAPAQRLPHFCSGCPHNTSTKVPDGSRALGGIGCHYMVTWMDRKTETFSQMGGEGAAWIGQAPFSKTEHVFTNIGDGTYFHSGSLAIRAAITAGVTITYKLLYNDAVAMTGGQPVDGGFTVPQIARQLAAEGVQRIAIVSEMPERFGGPSGLPHGTTVDHRDDFDRVQVELREQPGVTVLIYDQTCAAEKRRRRKRGRLPDPNRRVVINARVCEGCGDCSVQSNCLSVVPLDTEFGRKRTIDQSACNKDFSCTKGFCPSFVTVEGGRLKAPAPQKVSPTAGTEDLPEPVRPSLDRPYNILITGIGGTGVVTIGALLGMAVHLEGKGVGVLDYTGLAQKFGAVTTHIRIGETPEAIRAVRIAHGSADLLLGCDMVVAAAADSLSRLKPGATHAVLDDLETITSGFTRNPDQPFHRSAIMQTLAQTLEREDLIDPVPAQALATALCGDAIATNLFMVGYAYQRGLIPISAAAIDRAIELNGAAVDMNRSAFAWGRRTAVDRAAVVAAAGLGEKPARVETLDDLVARRADDLTAYQDSAYAARYRRLVEAAQAAERAQAPGLHGFADAVARSAHKLMAYKDEYEVGRLYSDGAFRRRIEGMFDGPVRLRFHLAPPLTAEIDPVSGRPKKQEFGPWMMRAFALLARFKRLRGTRWDVFGRTEERRMERRLIAEYEELVAELGAALTPARHGLAVELAALPLQMRGFGPVKADNVAKTKAREAELLADFRAAEPAREAAE